MSDRCSAGNMLAVCISSANKSHDAVAVLTTPYGFRVLFDLRTPSSIYGIGKYIMNDGKTPNEDASTYGHTTRPILTQKRLEFARQKHENRCSPETSDKSNVKQDDNW